jgi:hypothetical protein
MPCLASRGCVFEVAGDFRISMERDAAAGVPEEQVPHVCGKVIFANEREESGHRFAGVDGIEKQAFPAGEEFDCSNALWSGNPVVLSHESVIKNNWCLTDDLAGHP